MELLNYIIRYFLFIIILCCFFTTDVYGFDYGLFQVNSEKESGYLSAGYLLNVKGNVAGLCGVTVLSKTAGITAAHCIDDLGDNVIVGQGDINTVNQKNLKINERYLKPQWDGEDPINDLAILKIDKESSEFVNASIVNPEAGCGYRIVGYGQESEESIKDIDGRTKQGLDVCISEFNGSTFIVKAENASGGFCFGDSGSPIFEKDSNNIVGVVSAIRYFEDDSGGKCDAGNEVVAVSLSANISFIEQYTLVDNELDESLEDTIDTDLIDTDGVLPETSFYISEKYYILILGVFVIYLGILLLKKEFSNET